MGVVPDHFPSRRLFDTEWNALSDVELLTLLIGSGTPEERAWLEAQRIMDAVGSLCGLKEIAYSRLRGLGLGRRKALAVLAATHLACRLQRATLLPGQPFRSSIEVYRHFQPLVYGLKKECFWNVLLDGKNRVWKVIRVSEGSLTSSLVHPREVFRPAIQEAAAGVLFVHNHPSGDPDPSREDLEITRRLVETGRIVGIRALDHIILGTHRYFSFADQGLL